MSTQQSYRFRISSTYWAGFHWKVGDFLSTQFDSSDKGYIDFDFMTFWTEDGSQTIRIDSVTSVVNEYNFTTEIEDTYLVKFDN